MPRTATMLAAREDEETTTHVDELIQRGRGQGYLSLPELRDAFDQARVSPTEARSIIRELTEAGVVLGNEPADAAGLRSVVREAVSVYAVPKRVVVVPEFPLLPSGKPDKAALRRMGIQGASGGI